MKALFIRLATWLKSLFKTKGKRLFVLALKAAGSAATARYNDTELQQAALACIKAAAAKALHGDDAWADAWAAFRAHAIAAGKDWGRSTLETILQISYSNFKESLSKASTTAVVPAILLLPLLLAAPARAEDTNYVLRSDLAAYATLSDLDSYATTASLSNYPTLSDLAAYATVSDLAGLATTASLSNYPTLSDLSAYATASDLAGFATTASLSNYPTISDLSAYATASDLDGFATSDDLASYATTANLAAATAAASNALAAATASASNSFLHASPRTVGTNTVWDVDTDTEFNGEAIFDNIVDFEDDVTFNGSATLGAETRTNWPGARSITVGDGESAWVDDGLVWTDPDDSDVSIYLAHVTNATDRAHTVVIRDIGTDDGTVTDIYEGTSDPPVLVHTLTPTNRTAVFDWCPTADTWFLR